jgi:hypothetical protein
VLPTNAGTEPHNRDGGVLQHGRAGALGGREALQGAAERMEVGVSFFLFVIIAFRLCSLRFGYCSTHPTLPSFPSLPLAASCSLTTPPGRIDRAPAPAQRQRRERVPGTPGGSADVTAKLRRRRRSEGDLAFLVFFRVISGVVRGRGVLS